MGPASFALAGTHLVREWNGRTYQVEVIDNGYRFDGKTYPSLTAITKQIVIPRPAPSSQNR